jgi:TatD DNase family protein
MSQNQPKLIDTHTHLNFPDFYSSQEVGECIKRAQDKGIWVINVGSDLKSSKLAVEIAEKYDEGVYVSAGLHPNDNKNEIFKVEEYRKLISHPKTIAIGECGLDYFRVKKENGQEKERQLEIFKKQIELAIELNKPLMIHCRDTHDEVLEILETYRNSPRDRLGASLRQSLGELRGNTHFFSGTWEQAQKYFDLGFMISFTGVITFPTSPRLRRTSTCDYEEVIRKAPLDKIMIETDAPFVAPVPHRGQRNEPSYIDEVAKKIAEIKNISYEEAAKATTENAKRLFKI